MNDICRIESCEKIRDIKKRSRLCSMHRSRWSRNKSFDSSVVTIPNGFVMNCMYHGFRTDKEARLTKNGKLKPRRICIQCEKNWIKNNPEKHKSHCKKSTYKSHLKNKWGLSLEDFERLLDSQNGVCKICKKSETTFDSKTKEIKRLTVDHCHKTNAIRGLLCCKCNFGIGYFNDSIENLKNAIEYLSPN